MSTVSGGTGRGFSRLDWVLLIFVLFVLGPILRKALTAWILFFKEQPWSQ